ncbi:MAG TPA: DoxX family protein [Anaeromyxobacteraceae bacterium]|nr:DoxX family protein [Anaeromyxobacteraceae bacterium]
MQRLLAGLGPLVARVLLAAIFAWSGWQKLTVTGRAAAAITGRGLPYATALAYAACALELVGALMLVLGIRARAVALALAAYVVVASWLFHLHPALRGDAAQTVQLLKNAGLIGGLVLLSLHGPGTASVDRG